MKCFTVSNAKIHETRLMGKTGHIIVQTGQKAPSNGKKGPFFSANRGEKGDLNFSFLEVPGEVKNSTVDVQEEAQSQNIICK